MAKKVRIIDKDKGWGRLKREIAKARSKPHVVVGVFGTEAAKDHGGIPNIQVATTHEFGATLNHPGGTAYFVDSNGQAKFVSNAAAQGKNLPRTKPHKIVVPERSFIRGTVDANKTAISKMARSLAQQVLAGNIDTKRALTLLGLYVQGAIRKRMSKGIPPPLSPATIRRKTVSGRKGNVPLIDTGQLRASIDFEVRKA